MGEASSAPERDSPALGSGGAGLGDGAAVWGVMSRGWGAVPQRWGIVPRGWGGTRRAAEGLRIRQEPRKPLDGSRGRVQGQPDSGGAQGDRYRNSDWFPFLRSDATDRIK